MEALLVATATARTVSMPTAALRAPGRATERTPGKAGAACLLRLGPLSLSPHTVGTTGPLPLSPSGPQAQTAGQSPGRGRCPSRFGLPRAPHPHARPLRPQGGARYTPQSLEPRRGPLSLPPSQAPKPAAGSPRGRSPAALLGPRCPTPASGLVIGRVWPCGPPRCSARHLTPTPGLGAPPPCSGAAGPPPQSPASPPVCGHRGRSPHEEPGPRPRLGVPGLVPSRGLFLWLPDFRRLRACPSDPAPLCAWRSCASELDGPPTQPEGRRAPSLPSAGGQGSHWAGVGNISTG